MDLQAGQNTPLAQTGLVVAVEADGIPAGLDLDVSAFLLAETGKVRADDGMVFYGAPASPDGAVRLDPAARRFTLDLARLPAQTPKLAIVITIDQGVRRGQRFAQLGGVRVIATAGAEKHVFALDVRTMSETALILAEIYQRNGQWKLRAVGQGFTGGLGPLARHFGVDISDDPDATTQPSPPTVSTPPAPLPPPPAPPAAKPVNLGKITLEKARPVSLEKADGRFGEMVVNLRWTKGGGMFAKAVDLDLGAMVELHNGYKTVVQALNQGFGDLQQPPYVRLMGDDRSGASGDGEFLHINGNHWQDIKRVLIFAFIYDGIPNWSRANGSISIRMPGQPEIEARLDSPNDRDMMCAVALLENVNGAIRATKYVDYFSGHKAVDKQFKFRFNWVAGSK